MTVQIIADSIWEGRRITTFEIDIWKPLLAQLNTHGLIAKSAASSRAIPAKKLRDYISENPFMPIFTREQPGMAGGELEAAAREEAKAVWIDSLNTQLYYAEQLSEIGVHKEVANRMLEPYMKTKVVITATEWRNFLALRSGKGAQSEWTEIVEGIKTALETSDPRETKAHLPFLTDQDCLTCYAIGASASMVSAARCARTSFMIDQRPQKSIAEELDLAERLASEGHWSPFDHPAIAKPGVHGRFVGWQSFRSTFGDTAHGDLR